MSSAIYEFTAGQYQSAFQLAAALNFGLSIFRVLRQPAQEKVIDQTRALLELARNSSNLAASKMQLMEQAARDKCLRSGKNQNPDVEFPKYLDQNDHSKATEKMVELSVLELDAQQLSSDIKYKIGNWTETDGFIETSAVVFFFLSLFCLGYSTIYANQKVVDIAAFASACAFSAFAILNFTPVFLSFFFAFVARWRLSAMKKELQSCERKILRLQFTH
ncbi:hypothetical protein [Rhizobium leucaenae]|uniref:Uncharacterized protein n=1 Tax=Rhizobium leucaenae TaxID=29450 RepID=A0A7W6ZXF1_9HYPH|nr:hypothetical protein [Rhizobium leucaenae]MBB4570335.1 hypothetical protein [Rhizobium leucaenae]